MTTSNYDFSNLRALLDKADISVSNAAVIFKTTRVTIYSWCEGKAPTQLLLLNNTERLIRVIERAVEAGDLPLLDVDPAQKLGKIMSTLRKHLA